MIEFINEGTCTDCGKCIEVCPTDVFEPGTAGVPEISRKEDCTSCMNCELYCPADSIYVSPVRTPEADPGVPPELAKLGISAADWEKIQATLKSDVGGAGAAGVPEEYRGLVKDYFEAMTDE